MNLDTRFPRLNLGQTDGLAAGVAAHHAIDVGTRSDVGRVRENNEDSLRVAPELNLFLLSDGMGGQACGEVASRLAVDSLLTYCRETQARPGRNPAGEHAGAVNGTSSWLAGGIQWANRIVYRAAHENGDRRGMGATIVAVKCAGQRLSIAHVGDSRAYRLRRGCLEQLTQDHSLAMEQMRLGLVGEAGGGLRNILTRAVGVEPEVEVDIKEESMLDGDIVLLCSDGLTHELSDKQIAGILRDAENAQEAADVLVDFANQAGGADNITAIVIRRVRQTPGVVSTIGRLSRWFKVPGTRS